MADWVALNENIRRATAGGGQGQEQSKILQDLQSMILKTTIENKIKQNQFQQDLQMLQKMPKTEGYSYTLTSPGGMKVNFKPLTKKEPKPTDVFRDELKQAKAGEITWEDLKTKYPESSKQTEIEKIRQSVLPKVKKSPTFQRGWGLPALFSKDKAKITPDTQKVINNIKTQEDLEEFLIDYEKDPIGYKNVDKMAILEYFGQRGKGNEAVDFERLPGL